MRDFLKVMKACSDPDRVKILKMLHRQMRRVCEIQTALALAQPTVSSHLKMLEEAEIVRSPKEHGLPGGCRSGRRRGVPPVIKGLIREKSNQNQNYPKTGAMGGGIAQSHGNYLIFLTTWGKLHGDNNQTRRDLATKESGPRATG
ncbi:MAG: metalloregulator ArsR/SmtB family transcription factor [Pseudomonadota bacterium]